MYALDGESAKMLVGLNAGANQVAFRVVTFFDAVYYTYWFFKNSAVIIIKSSISLKNSDFYSYNRYIVIVII